MLPKCKYSTSASERLYCISCESGLYSTNIQGRAPRRKSKEVLINNTPKLQHLVRLRHQVFCSWSELFPWDINDCIELNCIWKKCNETMIIEKGKMIVQGNCVRLKTKEYYYTTSSFVAVISDSSREDAPFWIVKVVNSICNLNGRATNFTVHWYEMQKECNPLYGKYCPSYLQSKRKWKGGQGLMLLLLKQLLSAFPL